MQNRLNECAGIRLRSSLDDAIRRAVSLDEPIPGTDETLTLGETVADPDAGAEYETSELRIVLDECLSILPDEWRTVLEKRYYEDKSRAEVAAALGVGKYHVEHVEKLALRRIRSSGRVMSRLRAFHAEQETHQPDVYAGGLRSFTYAGSIVERAALWDVSRKFEMPSFEMRVLPKGGVPGGTLVSSDGDTR